MPESSCVVQFGKQWSFVVPVTGAAPARSPIFVVLSHLHQHALCVPIRLLTMLVRPKRCVYKVRNEVCVCVL
jgi:hypothetical protein